jgi:hypothetical protein
VSLATLEKMLPYTQKVWIIWDVVACLEALSCLLSFLPTGQCVCGCQISWDFKSRGGKDGNEERIAYIKDILTQGT